MSFRGEGNEVSVSLVERWNPITYLFHDPCWEEDEKICLVVVLGVVVVDCNKCRLGVVLGQATDHLTRVIDPKWSVSLVVSAFGVCVFAFRCLLWAGRAHLMDKIGFVIGGCASSGDSQQSRARMAEKRGSDSAAAIAVAAPRECPAAVTCEVSIGQP